jgi:hypothetical protein
MSRIFVRTWSKVLFPLVGARLDFLRLKRLHKRLRFNLLKSPAIAIADDGRSQSSLSKFLVRYSIMSVPQSALWPGR